MIIHDFPSIAKALKFKKEAFCPTGKCKRPMVLTVSEPKQWFCIECNFNYIMNHPDIVWK